MTNPLSLRAALAPWIPFQAPHSLVRLRTPRVLSSDEGHGKFFVGVCDALSIAHLPDG